MVDRAAVVAAVGRLDRGAMAGARWFGAKGRVIERAELEEAFLLDERGPHVLAIATLTLDDGSRPRYQVALTGELLLEAQPGDGAWRALAVAMAEGRIIPALPPTTDEPTTDDPTAKPGRRQRAGSTTRPGPVTAALVCRPGPALRDLFPGATHVATAAERDLGSDQSNTSVVLAERMLLKAYRRLEPGLNPDLELTAFLSEDADFKAVPRVAGFAELVAMATGTTTVAMAQEFIADGEDAFESTAESLAAWLLAPGEVSLEFATEIAADLGTLTARLHAALADGRGVPDMAPREATRAEVRAWAADARAHLDAALETTSGEAAGAIRDLAPRIAEALTVLDALPNTPEVIRAHGDYHLGQVLIAPDGFRIVDFEGEPAASMMARRTPRPALRDVASMLRSLDHVARSAGRRAKAQNDGPLERSGLDLPGWIRRARERFLEAYRTGLREERIWMDLDPDLLRAFEIDKELAEFVYAATYLPTWLYAPTEELRGLFEDAVS